VEHRGYEKNRGRIERTVIRVERGRESGRVHGAGGAWML
jgi:formylmethanofuran dehydrogenase subunit B